MSENKLMAIGDIQNRIYTIRGVQVMLDTDLSACYGVEVRRINEQVKHNKERFPDSFCFQLTDEGLEILKSQLATTSWGGRRTKPYAFTEQGFVMLSKMDIGAVEMPAKLEEVKIDE